MHDYEKRNGRITVVKRSQTSHELPLLDPNRQDNALAKFEHFSLSFSRFKPRSTRSDPSRSFALVCWLFSVVYSI